jgi:hypothetical protein
MHVMFETRRRLLHGRARDESVLFNYKGKEAKGL